jgi:hypothetical protein
MRPQCFAPGGYTTHLDSKSWSNYFKVRVVSLRRREGTYVRQVTAMPHSELDQRIRYLLCESTISLLETQAVASGLTRLTSQVENVLSRSIVLVDNSILARMIGVLSLDQFVLSWPACTSLRQLPRIDFRGESTESATGLRTCSFECFSGAPHMRTAIFGSTADFSQIYAPEPLPSPLMNLARRSGPGSCKRPVHGEPGVHLLH